MRKVIIFIPLLLILSACSAVILKPVDFAWPVESVLTTDATGNVSIDRYSAKFNATNLFKTEFSETTNAINKELRVIRGQDGYYYVTAPDFKHVYLLYARNNELVVEEKLLIKEEGLQKPFFNQQKPDIVLHDGDDVYIINNEGLKGEEK